VISLAIVVRDEAALLDELLTSVARAFAEVIVVDHGSTDASADVAQAHGARVLASSAESHELARNAYVEAAKMPWVLVVDADERVASCDRVHEAVRSAPANVHGFALERFDYLGRSRWASTRLVRLFRRDPRIRYFESRAHASVTPSVAGAGGSIALADAPLHHLDALLPRDHAEKRARMRERLEQEASLPNAPAILRGFLALEHFVAGDDDRASHELTRALDDDARLEPFVTLTRAQFHRARGRFAEAADEAARVLALRSDRFRGRTSAHAVRVDSLDCQGRTLEALAAAEVAVTEEPTVASHHVNLAALIEPSDPPRAALARATAARMNPWLEDPRARARVTAPGSRPSLFEVQDALIARADPGSMLER